MFLISLFCRGSLKTAACALYPVPLTAQMVLLEGCAGQKKRDTYTGSDQVCSSSAHGPRWWRFWLTCLWLQPSWLGQHQEEESEPLHGSFLLPCPVLTGLSPVGQCLPDLGMPEGCTAQYCLLVYVIQHSVPVVQFFLFFFFILALFFLPSHCKRAVFLPEISLQEVSVFCIALLFTHRPTTQKNPQMMTLVMSREFIPVYTKSTISSDVSFQSSDRLT